MGEAGPSGAEAEEPVPPPVEACNGEDDDGDGQVDEDFVDEDLDAVLDCLEGECAPAREPNPVEADYQCVEGPVPDPWRVRELWRVDLIDWGFQGAAVAVRARDTDGDGVQTEADAVMVVAGGTTVGQPIAVALDGATGVELWRREIRLFPLLAAADVDRDGWPEILTLDAEGHVVALDGDGNVEWTSVEKPTIAGMAVGDLEGDGYAEVLAGEYVLDGATGSLLFSVAGVNRGHADELAPGAIVDLDGDGDAEVLFRGAIFRAGHLVADFDEPSELSWVMPAQRDADDDAEAFWWRDYARMGWVEADGEVPFTADAAWYNLGCVLPGAEGGRDRVAFAMGVIDGDGVVRWDADAAESAYEGCVTVDLDRDGGLDLVSARGESFVVLDANSGAVHLATEVGVVRERPTQPMVVNLDADPAAEVVVFANGQLVALEHDGPGWAAVAGGWHQFNEDEVSVLADGTVNPAPGAWWLEGRGVRHRRALPGADLADLRVEVLDACAVDCTQGPVELTLQVENAGLVDLTAAASVTVSSPGGAVLAGGKIAALASREGRIKVMDLPLDPWSGTVTVTVSTEDAQCDVENTRRWVMSPCCGPRWC